MMESVKELIEIIRKRPKDGIILRYVDADRIHTITNDEFVSDVDSYIRGITRYFQGEPAGHHIALIAPTSIEYVEIVLAIELAGAVAVLINPLEEESEIGTMIERADVDLVIRKPTDYIVMDGIEDFGITEANGTIKDRAEVFSFLIYTSGTEGNMKGVMLSQRNVLTSAGDVTGVFGKIAAIRPDISFKSCYVMLPLYHVFGLSILFTAISGGVILDLCTNFKQFYRDLQLLGSEIIACPPMAIKMFVSDLMRGNRYKWGDGLKFIFSGAAKLPEDEQKIIIENGFFIAFGYGMTETAGPLAINCYLDKMGSVGRPSARTQVEIRDNEIFIRNNSVMLGYYKDPETTGKVLKDGWIATGDYGYIDEDGCLYITGRKKNLIILSSGENVSPEELENRLYKNTAIKECKVYEENDRIVADIFAPDSPAEEIHEFVKELNSLLPGFKRIYHVNLKDRELEKTASGKIKR